MTIKLEELWINYINIELKYAHLDSTSFHLHGEYKNYKNQNKETEIIKSLPINITKGYSRDHRADLKQVICDLIVNNEGLPLYTRAGDGNEADKAIFGKILVEFKTHIPHPNCHIGAVKLCDGDICRHSRQTTEHLHSKQLSKNWN